MKTVRNDRGFGLAGICIILAVVGSIVLIGWYIFAHRQGTPRPHSARASETSYVAPVVIMRVSYVGGLCANNQICASVDNLYDDGTFERHTKVDSSEISELEEIIDTTNFSGYPSNPHPSCPSYSDGMDEVLAFPRKYPNTSFKLCELQIPSDDRAFTFIDTLIKSHSQK